MSPVVCVKCQCDMKPIAMGMIVEEMYMGDQEGYKLWAGDAFECPGCGTRVVTRFGVKPIAENYQDKYRELARGVYCRAHERPQVEAST